MWTNISSSAFKPTGVVFCPDLTDLINALSYLSEALKFPWFSAMSLAPPWPGLTYNLPREPLEHEPYCHTYIHLLSHAEINHPEETRALYSS